MSGSLSRSAVRNRSAGFVLRLHDQWIWNILLIQYAWNDALWIVNWFVSSVWYQTPWNNILFLISCVILYILFRLCSSLGYNRFKPQAESPARFNWKKQDPYYLFKTARADLHDGIFTDEQAVIKQVMLCQFVMSCIRSVSVIDLLSMQIKMLTRGLQMYSVTF